MNRDMRAFDQEHAQLLCSLWFCGDVHGEFKYLAQALLDAQPKPAGSSFWVISTSTTSRFVKCWSHCAEVFRK